MPRAQPEKVSLDRSDSPIGVLYSTDEVAAFMGVTPRTVQRWIREGKLPAVVVGGTYRVKREELQAFVKAERGNGRVQLDPAARLPPATVDPQHNWTRPVGLG